MAHNDEDALKRLQSRIAEAQDKKDDASAEGSVSTSQMSMAWRISIELVAGVAVGGVLGYFADKWSGLSPLFLLLGIALGAISGFRNMARSIKNSE